MTSRERVCRALEFDHPDRVPRQMWMLPVARLEHGQAVDQLLSRWPTDISGPEVPNPALEALTRGDRTAVGQYRDEWGCLFENIHAGVIGQVKQPLLDDWSKLDVVRPPIEALQIDTDAINRRCIAGDQYMLAGCNPRVFERMQFLAGSENLLMDLADPPDALRQLIEMIHEFNCRELQVWAATAVDGLAFSDDWGGQYSLLISPDLWRQMFKPLYADYIRIAHDAGKKMFMHSDGHIFDIYEDLIEIGLDAINSQLFCMDIAEIGRRFAGRITFWGEIDRQHILPYGTAEQVRHAVKRVIKALHRPQGGVIAQFELGAGAKIENAQAVFEAWQQIT